MPPTSHYNTLHNLKTLTPVDVGLYHFDHRKIYLGGVNNLSICHLISCECSWIRMPRPSRGGRLEDMDAGWGAAPISRPAAHRLLLTKLRPPSALKRWAG